VGHTRDDQAETFLLRVARGSGLDGLAAMRQISQYPVPELKELVVVRPMLTLERDEVRAHLTALGQDWHEDPMNRDPRFSRARIRESWPALESLGLTKERLASAADHLSRAREALDLVTLAILARSSRFMGATAFVERHALIQAPRELGLRALAALLMAVSGQAYRPRFSSLERIFDRIRDGELQGGCTLHGCRIAPAPKRRAIFGPGTVLIEAEGSRRAEGPEMTTQNT
jgi:tRNA(Ile)-lysidine synthase